MSDPTGPQLCLTAEINDLPMVEWPFSAEQVAEGAPTAIGAVLWRSPDRSAAAGFWRCDAGTFTRTYPWTEVATILAGAATVTTSDGDEHELHPGTVLVLPVGTTATWTIPASIQKAFHLSADEPLPV